MYIYVHMYIYMYIYTCIYTDTYIYMNDGVELFLSVSRAHTHIRHVCMSKALATGLVCVCVCV